MRISKIYLAGFFCLLVLTGENSQAQSGGVGGSTTPTPTPTVSPTPAPLPTASQTPPPSPQAIKECQKSLKASYKLGKKAADRARKYSGRYFSQKRRQQAADRACEARRNIGNEIQDFLHIGRVNTEERCDAVHARNEARTIETGYKTGAAYCELLEAGNDFYSILGQCTGIVTISAVPTIFSATPALPDPLPAYAIEQCPAFFAP